MKRFLSLLLLSSSLLGSVALGQATIDYSAGTVFTSDASGPSWVGGSLMYKFITSGSSTGTAQSGFSTIPDITLLTWSFDDLDLDIGDSISPGAASAGLEVYRDTDSSSNLQFSYNGALWVSGLITEYRVNVDNNNDFDATGVGVSTITSFTAAGEDFYNEIMTLSGGSGEIGFTADSFAAVAAGEFTSAGSLTISAVPEPNTYALWLGMAVVGFTGTRRRHTKMS